MDQKADLDMSHINRKQHDAQQSICDLQNKGIKKESKPFDVGIRVMHDPIADALDDMAALAEYWKKNREKGRMPSSIRQAMLLTAREALMLQDIEQREINENIAKTFKQNG